MHMVPIHVHFCLFSWHLLSIYYGTGSLVGTYHVLFKFCSPNPHQLRECIQVMSDQSLDTDYWEKVKNAPTHRPWQPLHKLGFWTFSWGILFICSEWENIWPGVGHVAQKQKETGSWRPHVLCWEQAEGREGQVEECFGAHRLEHPP